MLICKLWIHSSLPYLHISTSPGKSRSWSRMRCGKWTNLSSCFSSTAHWTEWFYIQVEGPYDKCKDYELRGDPKEYYSLIMQVGQEIIEIHEFKPGRRSRAIIESWKIIKTLGERKDWWCWQVWQAHVWFACLVCIKHSCLGLSGWEPRTEYVAIFSFVSFSFWFVWFVLMNLAASQIVTIVWSFVCWDFLDSYQIP